VCVCVRARVCVCLLQAYIHISMIFIAHCVQYVLIEFMTTV
jgi:hypothetical protein